jgi:predicted nucleic acid-binding protein
MKPMIVASFIDSNIFIYAEANDLPEKQSQALALLRRLKISGTGIISTQVLQEYCNVALRKLGLRSEHIRLQLRAHEQFEVVQITSVIIHGALDLQQTRSLSFYDALIVQAAKVSGCNELYSEDLNAGEAINGVKIINPFMQPMP